ncbi:MAG TPA: LacI family DNA-binding transcriptional regulator [Pseudonocardiaceae bacterium]|nr:LacI family DNA-binding transcriptional regulator [Pseudonocardiaceae bacterium]
MTVLPTSDELSAFGELNGSAELKTTGGELKSLGQLNGLGQGNGARPTLLDVARAAGVSAATASRVLNGFHQVRQETRRQVEGVMAELGYVRQRSARTVRPDRTGSIAFVVCEEGPRLFADPFFARVLWGASR